MIQEQDHDRSWSELTAAEQDELIDQAAAEEPDVEVVEVERIDPGAWAPTEGDDDGQDAYAEGVDASPGGETP